MLRLFPLLGLLLTLPTALAPAVAAPADDLGRLRISQRPCSLNGRAQTCVITVEIGRAHV